MTVKNSGFGFCFLFIKKKERKKNEKKGWNKERAGWRTGQRRRRKRRKKLSSLKDTKLRLSPGVSQKD